MSGSRTVNMKHCGMLITMPISTPRPWLDCGEQKAGGPDPVENNIWYLLLVFAVVVVVVKMVVELEVAVGVVVLRI